MKRKIPVIIRLREDQVYKADLMKEVKISKYGLTKQLRNAPGKYAWWASMYSMATKKVSFLEERLELLEARLFIRYSVGKRVSDIKHLVTMNSECRKLRTRLRKWKDYERHLKFAEKSMEKRLYALQSINANARKEWDTDKSRGGDE